MLATRSTQGCHFNTNATPLPLSNSQRLKRAFKLDYVWPRMCLTAQSRQINRASVPAWMLKLRQLCIWASYSSALGRGQRSKAKSFWFKVAFTMQILVNNLCLCTMCIGQLCYKHMYNFTRGKRSLKKFNSDFERRCGTSIVKRANRPDCHRHLSHIHYRV